MTVDHLSMTHLTPTFYFEIQSKPSDWNTQQLSDNEVMANMWSRFTHICVSATVVQIW